MSQPITNRMTGDVSSDGGPQFLQNRFESSTINFNMSSGSGGVTSEEKKTNETQQKRQELLKALDFPYRQVRMAQVSELRSPGESFSWVWDSNLVQWLRSTGPLFWIAGKPASGKSTLINYLIRNPRTQKDLQQNDGRHWTVIYHFFDFRAGEGIGNNFQGFLRSLLYQLIKTLTGSTLELQQDLFKIVDESSVTHWTLIDLEKALMRFSLREDHPICLLLDGLDEYEGNKVDLISFIRQFSSSHKKICLASRPDPPFPDAFKDAPSFKMQTLNKPGIIAFGTKTLTELFLPTSTTETEELTSLAGEVADRALGVFLWARFATYELIDGITNGEDEDLLLKRLEAFPSELGDVYSRIMKRKSATDRKLFGTVLLLICYSRSLLTLPLVFSALLLASKVKGDPELYPGSQEAFGKRLVAISGGMIDVIRYKKGAATYYQGNEPFLPAVQTTHKTVRRYLDQGGWSELLEVCDVSKCAYELWLQICIECIQVNKLLDPSTYNTHPLATALEFNDMTEKDVPSSNSIMAEVPYNNDWSPDTFEDLFGYTILLIHEHALKYEQSNLGSTFKLLAPVFTEALCNLHCMQLYGGCNFCSFSMCEESSGQRQEVFAAIHALELFVKDSLASKYTSRKASKSKMPRKSSIASNLARLLKKTEDKENVDSIQNLILLTLRSRGLHHRLRLEKEYTGIIQACLSISGSVGDDIMALGLIKDSAPILRLLLENRRDKPLVLRPSNEVLYSISMRKDSHNPRPTLSALQVLAHSYSTSPAVFEQILQLLLNRGEDINALYGRTGTALNDYLEHFLFYDAFKLEIFVKYGADINKRGVEGNALEITWYRAHTERLGYMRPKAQAALTREIIGRLIDMGGTNNRPDPNGLVPSQKHMLGFSYENFEDYVRIFWGKAGAEKAN